MGKNINLKDSFPSLYENFEGILNQCKNWQIEFSHLLQGDKRKQKPKKPQLEGTAKDRILEEHDFLMLKQKPNEPQPAKLVDIYNA